tara:strand:- start:3960 stop:5483 length:1524 start_codon:yes stop_codon:yes gene_type:complete
MKTIKKTIYEIIASNDKESIVFEAPGETKTTYHELREYINLSYKQLSSLNLNSNDKIGIVLNNGSSMAATFIAIASNFISCPLNPSFTKEEFKFYLKDLDIKIVIIEKNKSALAREAADELNIRVINLNNKNLQKVTSLDIDIKEKKPISNNKYSEKNIAMILHTSGTTSRPKMVPLTHKNLVSSAKNISHTLNLNKNDRCLNIMPMFHIHGLVAAILAPIFNGGSIITPSGFDTLQFFKWVNEFKPTWYTAVPTMHQTILARSERNKEIIKNNPLKFIRSSSASLPSIVMQNLEKAFRTSVIESYGMTEAAHQMTSNPLPPKKRKAGFVGIKAGPEVALLKNKKIIKNKPHIEGQIIIKGDNVTEGYLNNEKANSESFYKGWFLTGDEGIFDEEGYLKISGRIKEIINRGGEKISPKEIDEALMDHENVQQAVTFSVPHEKLGEDLSAAVVLKDNSNCSEEDLKNYCKNKLAKFKIPRKIVILDAIPKGPTGKLQRIGLADKLGIK